MDAVMPYDDWTLPLAAMTLSAIGVLGSLVAFGLWWFR